MAVKKLVYKHLNSLGFKKYGPNCIKRIGDTNYYGAVAIARDKHYSYKDEGRSIENGISSYVACDKIFYDIRCEVFYVDPCYSEQEMKDIFRNSDTTYSLCEVNSADKFKLFKSKDEADEKVVSEILNKFNKFFYFPVYKNKGRSIIANDDNASLFTYVQSFYKGSTLEYLFADTLCHMAYDEGKYEDAIYYAKMALIGCRPGQYDYAAALDNFHKVYSTIKLGGWETDADIVGIYENSIRQLYNGLTE